MALASLAVSPVDQGKDLYDVGEIPPLGHVPAKMHTWAIRRDIRDTHRTGWKCTRYDFGTDAEPVRFTERSHTGRRRKRAARRAASSETSLLTPIRFGWMPSLRMALM